MSVIAEHRPCFYVQCDNLSCMATSDTYVGNPEHALSMAKKYQEFGEWRGKIYCAGCLAERKKEKKA